MTTTTETTFKVGDKVSFHEKDNVHWQGGHGIILAVHPGTYGTTKYDLELVESPPKNVAYNDGAIIHGVSNYSGWVTLVEPSFTFADIQVGDTIRRTQTFKGGATEVREGTVTHVKSWYVAAEGDSYILAYDTDDKEEVTLELLNRPEPVKEVWEDAKPGDVFRRVNDIGEVGHVVRTEDGWRAIYTTDSRTWSSSFDPSSTHLFDNQKVTAL